MTDLAAKVVDAIFDQWSADCGLTRDKALERVSEVLAGYSGMPLVPSAIEAPEDDLTRQVQEAIIRAFYVPVPGENEVFPEDQKILVREGPQTEVVCGCRTCSDFRLLQGQYKN